VELQLGDGGVHALALVVARDAWELEPLSTI
jgi:hypothetical protein